jgi:hypothetical protein
MRLTAPLLVATLAPCIALADPMMETITPGNTLTAAPTEWLGDKPHLVIMGMVDGKKFDVQVMDITSADISAITLKREYLLNDTDYNPYQELDFGIEFMHEGIPKGIEGKLTHADFNTLAALPATFALQSAEEYPAGDLVFTEFEYKWESGGVTVDAESADWDGSAVLHMDTAFKAEKPNGDGMIGAYITGSKGESNFVVSFTLPVTEFEVED